MPALRKRLSRPNTPFATPNDTPPHESEPRKGKMQSSLDGWMEPPVKNPTPSFEEHGFARHGVLENMGALGVPPSARVKQKARATNDSISRGPFSVGKSNGGFGEEGASTPEMTPARELDQEDEERLDEDDPPAVFAPQDEDEDDDYIPKKTKPKAYVAKTPVRGKTPVNKTPVQGKTPVRNGSSRPQTAVASPVVHNETPSPFDPVTKQRTLIAVNAAIDRSNTGGKRDVGHAIRELWNDSTNDPSLAETLYCVMQWTASTPQLAVFRNYIKTRKRMFKRNKREQARKAREEQEARDAQKAQEVRETEETLNPSSAADQGIIAPKVTLPDPFTTTASPVQDSEPAAPASLPSVDIIMQDHHDDVPHIEVSSVEPVSVVDAPDRYDTAPTLPASASSSPPPIEKATKSPRKLNGIVNGEVVLNSGLSTNAHTPTPKPADEGDSDLSDVNEEIVQNGPPEPTQANGNGAAIAPKKAKNAALARAGKKSRANSVKPPGKHEKRPPLTAEEVAEQLKLQKRRQELVEQQPSYLDYNPPTSDVRFDDEMLETESLTESQIAVGPPVDTDQPRRPGRVPRNSNGMNMFTGKRLRDGSSAQPSPQFDSAASTRPSTPAIAPPFPKRLKLNNGQAARTKRSPVKNRDGPIAGIPHLGGGGSRQLGPDDNTPGSPPSESDDFCAACKGAGDFVCCDYCPRVFHFLCLDPPRQDAPTGSFSCFECTVEHKPTEEPADSYSHFGPLFKEIEHTNTRAFALPHDVQNYFESVTAQPDGSFVEEVKKFPLSKNSGYGYQKPDYLKTTDSDHKVILCTQCGKSSGGKRQMLKCDFCHTYWHLDCCDPPLANPPHISLDAAQRDAWKCPRHIDHDLRSGQLMQHDLNEVYHNDVAMVDRIARKVRRPRNAEIIEPTFSRGMRNNGLVDILNNADDDTDGEGNYVFASEDYRDLNSKVFRIPEKGIVLDFLTKVKNDRFEQRKQAMKAKKAIAKQRASFQIRPIEQQQAAINLARLANKEKDIGLSDHSVNALVLGLTAEAPNEVLSAISNGPPPAMTSQERAELQKLQKLINLRLATYK